MIQIIVPKKTSMNDSEILPPPVIESSFSGDGKLAGERQAFRFLLPTLHESYSDTYVAIHEGQVIDNDKDDAALASRVYDRYGYIPIYVGFVGEEAVCRVPSPRVPIASGENW